MSPDRRRGSDGLRSLVERARDLVQRAVRRQTHFSVASSALAAVLVITMLFDMVVGHAHLQRMVVAGWLLSYIVLAALPLVFGRRYPRLAGLGFIAYLIFWSAYSLTHAVHAHALLNALFEAPMIGLYLGWFYRGLTARVTLSCYLVILSAAVLTDDHRYDSGFSVVLVLAYTLLISFFCLETGSHLYRRSRHQAMIDPLTGALNRRGLDELASSSIARAMKAGESFSFFAVDFDNFKAINDGDGHAAGDDALRSFGSACLNGLAGDDLVARTGGDEFALLVHGDADAACDRVKALRSESRHAWSWGHIEYRPGDTLDSLLRRADQELYRQKRARRH